MAGVLASVRDLAEAEIALRAGVDVLDLKEPARGSLGAWDPADVAEAVRRFAGRVPVSATVGDLPLDPALVLPAVRAMAEAGVDVVKIGLFDGDPDAIFEVLAREGPWPVRLVAVAFADRGLDPALPARLAACGFSGLVIDTADKSRGRLLDHATPARLADPVALARARGLFVGLAGSLRVGDIAALAPCGADLLGFRGALCTGSRTGRLDARRVRAVVAEVHGRTGGLPPEFASRLLREEHRHRHGRRADVDVVA